MAEKEHSELKLIKSKYPKTRLVCGELQRIKTPDAAVETYPVGDWALLAMVKEDPIQ